MDDRLSNIERYYGLFARFARFSGKSVAELGCSTGYLLKAFRQQEQFSPIGIDIDRSALARGRAEHGNGIHFVESTASGIPLPNESVDVVYTVDTVEHLSRAEDIFRECYRLLRPGGVFLVHFHPWLGPYGSHLEDILPLPWLHTVFSMETLLNAAAYLYASDEYTPAYYWFDPDTGKRRPNPYTDHQHWKEYLNHMTIRQFRRMLKVLPFETVHFERIGFSGKAFRVGHWLRGLSQIPLLDEFFVFAVFCVLKKPIAHWASLPIRSTDPRVVRIGKPQGESE
ncbi:MAG: class I SAM-dependent methyltransferase [Candidatus Rokubacteria bacterium]|nr:class I SAM-dependent methyltransferase [Candidatus Rokubacteria bacterium]